MAEAEAATQAAGKATSKGLGFLTQKVGPLPLGVWLVAGVGIFWYMSKKNKVASGAQTDSAGNVGTIDPATGYVYGSAQDQSALASNAAGGGGTSDNTSGNNTTGAYSTNAAWGQAAVNYLVARGIDATEANEAVQQYLASQALTTQQQADINLAIQGLGPPPQLPGPTGTPPTPIVTPGPTPVYATNPPGGVSGRSDTPTTMNVWWHTTANATGYTVKYGTTSAATGGVVSVDSSVTSTVLGGLTPGTLYYVQVQAVPTKPGDGFGTTQQVTQSGGPGIPAPPGGGQPHTYTVKSGDTLSGIAGKLGVSQSTLYSKNQATIESTAKAHGYSSSQNGHWIFPGEVLTY